MSPSIPASREAWPFRAGRIAFGIALLLFGGEHLLRGRLVAGLPPLPAFLPGSHMLALTVGACLLIAGTLLLADARRELVAAVTGATLIAAAALHLLHSHAILFEGSPRTVFLETLAMGACALALAGDARATRARAEERPALLVARLLFAFTLLLFGLQHFEYVSFISALIPWWIPNHRGWVVFTGAVFLLAAVALAVKFGSRLAAYSLALMFFSWLLLLHVPRILAHPQSGDEWASGFVVLALGGGSLVFAAIAPDRMRSA